MVGAVAEDCDAGCGARTMKVAISTESCWKAQRSRSTRNAGAFLIGRRQRRMEQALSRQTSFLESKGLSVCDA